MDKRNNKDFEHYFLNDGLEVVYAKAEESSADEKKGSIVFVHGVCHGAWCWKNFLTYFADRGYNCFAFSLRGHGESKGNWSKPYRLKDYVEDVQKVVEHCIEKTGDNPFLLGHSMGGAIVQNYIDKNSECVSGAILFAPVTAGGMGWKSIFKTAASRNGRCTLATIWGKANKNLKESNFFVAIGEKGNYQCRITDAKELQEYDEKLCAESFRAMFGLAKYDLENDIEIPVFVIGSSADAYFPSDSLNTTAGFYKTEPFILDNLCHDMMLDPDWEKTVARAVLEFLKNPAEVKKDPQKFVAELDELIKR